MILIVGLGNPSPEYAKTRHNFGFMVVDALAQKSKVEFRETKKFLGEVAELQGSGTKVWLLKPTTFMNNSGEAVAALANFYKIDVKNIWIVADDLDLPLGKIRIRHGGESGGHHGLESIQQCLKSNAFVRMRMGIRGEEMRNLHREHNVATNDFVLSAFHADEHTLVASSVSLAVALLEKGIGDGEMKAHTHEVDGFDTAQA